VAQVTELDLMSIPESLTWIGETLGLGHRICPRTLIKMRIQGLPVHQIGDRIMVSQADFLIWVATRKSVPVVHPNARPEKPRCQIHSKHLSRIQRIASARSAIAKVP
jgi:hypothetical protein